MTDGLCAGCVQLELSRLSYQETYAREIRLEKTRKLTVIKLQNRIKEMEDKSAIQESENEDLRYQIDQLTAHIEDSENHLTTVKKSHQEAIDSLEGRVKVFVFQYDDMKVELDNVRSALSEANEQLASLRRELLCSQSQIQSTSEDNLEKDTVILQLREKLANAERERHAFQDLSEIKESFSSSGTQTDPDAQVQSLTQEVTQLTACVEEARDQLNEANYVADDATDQLRSLQEREKESDCRIAALDRTNKALQDLHSAASVKLSAANEEIERITRNWKELLDSKESYKKELRDGMHASSILHTANMNLRKECDAHLATIAELEAAMRKKEKRQTHEIAMMKKAVADMKRKLREVYYGDDISNPSANSLANDSTLEQKSPHSGVRESYSTDGRDSAQEDDSNDEYGADEFESEESLDTDADGVSDNNTSGREGGYVGRCSSPVRSGVLGVKRMASGRFHAHRAASGSDFYDENDDQEIEGRCSRRVKNAPDVMLSASESAPLLPSLRAHKKQDVMSGLPIKSKSRYGQTDGTNVDGRKIMGGGRKSKKKNLKDSHDRNDDDDIDDALRHAKKVRTLKKKKTKKKSSASASCEGDTGSHYSHPTRHSLGGNDKKPSCSECGFHFVGAGMKLPTTLQQVLDDESVVSAGYNIKQSSKDCLNHRQQSVRDLYGWRRGEGCVFCSWGCARVWNQKHTPVQLKYQTDRLIIIASEGKL